MEQNSETAEVGTTPEPQNMTNTDAAATTGAAAASSEAAAAETAAAETAAPRRRSRRATAAVGEAVDPASVPGGAPAVDAAEPAAAAADPAASAASAAQEASSEPAPEPKKRASRSRKKVETEAAADAPAESEASAGAGAGADAAAADAPEAEAAPATRSRAASTRSRKPKADADTPAEGDVAAKADADGATTDAEAESTPRKRPSRGRGKKSADANAQAGTEASSTTAEGDDASSDRKADQGGTDKSGADKSGADKSGADQSADQGASEKSGADKNGSDKNGSDKGGDRNGNDRNGDKNGQQRSSRTRQRERKRRGQGDDFEPEIAEDDVLLPIAGVLDVLDNYAFVRTSGYLPGTNDVYVSLGQVKKYGLRKGDSVVGAIRQPRDGENSGGRQKYNAIVRVDTVNSRPADDNEKRADFADFTPIHPVERLRLETETGQLTARVIDLFAPVGKGQRGLIIGPHESGKSTALRAIASAVSANQADAHLMLVLLDERPEDVTELQRTVNGEVIASTFDRTAEDHITIAELAVERAKRLVELGHDVVLLIDSLTSLARSYNTLAPATSRVPAGNLDAAAIYPVKKLLSAARNIENGGSLTIIATVSAQPESRVDDAVIGELEATANLQLRLSGDAAERRVYPAVDLGASSTRRAELLTSDAEAKVMDKLRRSLATQNSTEALEGVLDRLSGTSSNVEFLALAQRSN